MRRQSMLVLTGLLTSILGFGCVNEEQPISKDPPAEVQKLIVDKAPENLTPINANFDDKITLIGVQVEPGLDVAAGKRVKVTMYWRADKALDDPSWKLFTHLLDGAGDRLLNIDNVGPLRQLSQGSQAWPPGRWVPGKVYVDTQSFTMPRKVKSATVQLVTGIWKGRDRLALKSGASVSEDRALVATFTTSSPAKPERTVPELAVARVPKGASIKLDGTLDEAAWKDAAETGAFVDVRKGGPDADSDVQGSAKLLWDEKALFVAVTVRDEDVQGGFDKATPDPHLWTKDCVEIMIDPEGDGDNKDYYEIQINPQNLVFDSQFDEYNKPKQDKGPFGHQEWSAKLESGVSIQGTLDNSDDDDQGYIVEARIPWSSFVKTKGLAPKVGDAWRLNLYAMHDNSGVAWSPILGQGNFHKAARFARVRWVEKKGAEPALTQGPEKLGAPTAEAAAKPKEQELVVQKRALQQASAAVQPTPAVPPPPPKLPAAPAAPAAPAPTK
jgi:hypothetical protein